MPALRPRVTYVLVERGYGWAHDGLVRGKSVWRCYDEQAGTLVGWCTDAGATTLQLWHASDAYGNPLDDGRALLIGTAREAVMDEHDKTRAVLVEASLGARRRRG